MRTTYCSIAGPVEAEVEDRRSRFICRLAPVADEDAAQRVIDGVRMSHPDAHHHCTAVVLGPESTIRRSSDDGEPAGTAGPPILQALLGADLTDVVAVVTRYFGGTLLGAGGLIRAYGAATRAAIDRSTARRFRLGQLVEITADHATAARLESDLRERDEQIVAVDYAERVTLRVVVADVDRTRSHIAGASHGTAGLRVVGSAWRPQ